MPSGPSSPSIITGRGFDAVGYRLYADCVDRYQRLPPAAAEIVGSTPLPVYTAGRIQVADVGCGDLAFSIPFMCRLSELLQVHIDADLCDNDSRMVQESIGRLGTTCPWPGTARVHQTDASAYLEAGPPHPLSTAVYSHVFYHLAPEMWIPLIGQTLSHMLVGGAILVVMRSWSGQWWQLTHPVPQIPSRASFVFSEDLTSRLSEAGIPYHRHHVPFFLRVVHDRDLLDVAAFLYRVDPQILKGSTAACESILSRTACCRTADGSYSIGLVDEIVCIWKAERDDV